VPRLVLATRNAHKVRELRAILAAAVPGLGDDDLGGLPADLPDVAETGVTFADNALLKARAACAATGLPALADDSGLAVDVLGGAPGVFSARWAGRHGDDAANLALLLAQLADVLEAHRGAAFVCAAALVAPGGVEVVEHGRLAGTLAQRPRGGHGFGYDPVLVPAGESRTCAELSPAEKDAISHRGQAFRAIAPAVARLISAATPSGASP
jgi:XTP/dITP diphosphohydrolase